MSTPTTLPWPQIAGTWIIRRSSCLENGRAIDAAIFVHPWDMMGKERMPKYWLPWLVGMPAETSLAICSMIFGGVFERFPKFRVAFAHGGGAFPFTIGRIEHGFHVRPDLCRDRQQDESARLSGALTSSAGAVLCRFACARRRRLDSSDQALRGRTRRARLRLSFPVRRSETG